MTRLSSAYRLQTPSSVDEAALSTLYTSVGWSVYGSDPDLLMAAIEGSDFVVTALADDELIGLARCISDDSTIVYIQDIVVHPSHHRQGVGRALVEAISSRYAHVGRKVLLTDDRPEQLGFYESLGFTNTRQLVKTPLNAFVRVEGQSLE